MLSSPHGNRRRSVTVIAALLLVLSALSLGVYHAHEQTLAYLSRSLSRTAGTEVRVGGLRGGLRAGLGPTVIIEEISVGGESPLLTISRAEADLELHLSSKPTIKQVRLIRPMLQIGREQWTALEGKEAQRDGRRVDKHATTTWRTRVGRSTEVVVVDGSLRAEIPMGQAIYKLESRGIYVRRHATQPGWIRIVAGQTALSRDGERLVELNATSADLDPGQGFRPVRVAALGGSALFPKVPGASIVVLAATLEQRLDGFAFKVDGKPAGRSTGRFTLTGQLGEDFRPRGPEAIMLALNDVDLSALEPLLEEVGVKTDGTRLNGSLSIQLLPGGARLRTALAASALKLRHPLVSSRTIGPFDGIVGGEVTIAPERGKISIQQLSLDSGAVHLELAGEIELTPKRTTLALDLSMPDLPCQQLLSSMPAGFTPKLSGMALAGEIGLKGRLRLDTTDVERTEVDLDLSPLKCRVLADPPAADVHSLAKEITITVSGPRGVGMSWALGPSNPGYQRFSRISRNIKAAFIVAEDGRFYRHEGFDKRQLRRAFISNLQESRVRRGASTISQQVVKNVFLNHERTLSRKFQEAVLTWRMEQVIPKKRILELYLNLVEMGPGIYGVGQASQHYFGRSPRRVTPLQAAHLAALTPSPRHLGQRFRNGDKPGPAWREKLTMLLRMMRRRGTITREEQRRWSSAQLTLQH